MQGNSFYYRQALAQARADFTVEVQAGRVKPNAVPWAFLNFITLAVWLFFTSRTQRRMHVYTRLAAFALILWLSVRSMVTYRSLSMASGIMIGISSAWCCIVALDFVLIKDPRLFKRIVLRKNDDYPRPFRETAGDLNSKSIDNKLQQSFKNSWENRLTRQSCPKDPFERLSWVLDLIFTLLGTNWTWDEKPKPIPTHSKQSRLTGLQRSLLNTGISYLCIDVLKLLIIHDPYFIGFPDAELTQRLSQSLAPWILHTFHLLVTFASIYLAVFFVSSLGPLLFVNMLGSNLANVNGEPWMYSPPFGSLSAIPNRGLAGFWGQWWHQSFRLHLKSIADWLVDILGLNPAGNSARYLRYSISFILSGFLHACGSFTMWGPTRPGAVFLFFVLQPLGIMLQSLFGMFFSAVFPSPLNSTRIRQCSRFIFTLVWFRLTFSLLADDFASGLQWFVEPLPISPLRGLAFGDAGVGGWYCWCSPSME